MKPLVLGRCEKCGLFYASFGGERADHLAPDEVAWVAACFAHGDKRLPFLRSKPWEEEWMRFLGEGCFFGGCNRDAVALLEERNAGEGRASGGAGVMGQAP